MEIHITPGMIPTTKEDDELTEMGELQETINMLGETIQELNEDEELKKLIKKVETAQKKVDEKRNCGIKINWKELIEDCIKNKIENDVYAMQMRNNENNTLTVIKRRTEIENTTIGEEDMKTNATEIHITPGMIPTTEEDNALTEMGELQETINMLGETITELEEDEDYFNQTRQRERKRDS